jgi:glycosyltransferase involved in cell wall biosynthesis
MKISAVITCYESIGTIGQAILSLAAQSRRPDEIVVTDDGSSADTCLFVQRVLAATSAAHGIATSFVTHERTAPYRLNTIRNAGIGRATGEVIFLLDGDIFVPRDFVASHAAIHTRLAQAGRRAFVSCVRRNLSGAGSLEEGRVSEWGHQLDRLLLSRSWEELDLEPEQTLSQASFLRIDWERVGGFDPDFDGHWGFDEVEFAFRLKRIGTLLTCHGIVFHLTEGAALGGRDATRNQALYEQKKKAWIDGIAGGA